MSSLQQILNITDEEIKVAMSIMTGNVANESVNEIISEETPIQKVGKEIIKKVTKGNFSDNIAKKVAEREAERAATRAANKGKTTVDSATTSTKPAETPELKVLPTTKPSQSPVSDVFNDIKNSLPATPQKTLIMPDQVAKNAPRYPAPPSKTVNGKTPSNVANDNPANQNSPNNNSPTGNLNIPTPPGPRVLEPVKPMNIPPSPSQVKTPQTGVSKAPETGVSDPSKSLVKDTRIPLNYKKIDTVVGPAATIATGAAILANPPNGKVKFTDFDKKVDVPEPTVKPNNVSSSDFNKPLGQGGIGSDAARVQSQVSQVSQVSQKVAPRQKEMSADELNTISLSLAKGNTPDVAAGTGDDREKKRDIADRIKNRMTTLTIRKEEIDLEQELKPNKPKYKWVEGSKVDKIPNNNPPVKFGEPGNEPVDNLKNLKTKKEPLKLSIEEENIDINRIIDESRAQAIHTGKIKSSKRIIKVLQKAADNDIEVSFDFENGTQATIQPAIAKLALAHYNNLSPFGKAQVAKKMRESFKSFIQSTRGR